MNTPRRPRTCEVCLNTYTPTYYKQRTCGRACGSVINSRPRAEPKPLASKLTWRECPHCSQPYTTQGKRRCECVPPPRMCPGCDAASLDPGKKLCSACRTQRAKQRRKAQKKRSGPSPIRHHRARARKYGVEYEPVHPKTVFERDLWMCHLCGDAIDPHATWPDQMCASLDHLVPMSKGGPHVAANLRAAHWLCNSLKSSDETVHFRLVA